MSGWIQARKLECSVSYNLSQCASIMCFYGEIMFCYKSFAFQLQNLSCNEVWFWPQTLNDEEEYDEEEYDEEEYEEDEVEEMEVMLLT